MEMTHERRPVVLLRAKSWVCAFGIEDAIEIMRPRPIQALAGAPGFVRGLAIVRGAMLPVLDLAALLGAGPTEGWGRFLVARSGPRQIALAVDEFMGVSWIDPSLLANVPPLLHGALPEDVHKLGTLDGHGLALLQTGKLVPEDVWKNIAVQGAR
jgi:purine-binding chemotaxis protein CheW